MPRAARRGAPSERRQRLPARGCAPRTRACLEKRDFDERVAQGDRDAEDRDLKRALGSLVDREREAEQWDAA